MAKNQVRLAIALEARTKQKIKKNNQYFRVTKRKNLSKYGEINYQFNKILQITYFISFLEIKDKILINQNRNMVKVTSSSINQQSQKNISLIPNSCIEILPIGPIFSKLATNFLTKITIKNNILEKFKKKDQYRHNAQVVANFLFIIKMFIIRLEIRLQSKLFLAFVDLRILIPE